MEFENDEIRLQMKKYGIMPQRTWNERPIYISSTPGIFESYIVPEGDGKFSPITTMVYNIEYNIIKIKLIKFSKYFCTYNIVYYLGCKTKNWIYKQKE